MRAEEVRKSESRLVIGRIAAMPRCESRQTSDGSQTTITIAEYKQEMSESEKTNERPRSYMRTGSQTEWNQINWPNAEKAVAQLQARIVKAQQEGRHNKVKSLSRILTHSFHAKALAVKRVTTNRGSRTAGVDGRKWSKNEEKVQAILELQQEGYRAKPLRRKYIQKQGSNKMRPLGIPTMKDRAMQAMHNMALSPIAETTGDPNSYGFRPFRCCQDAIEQIATIMGHKIRPQWVLEGDIKGCFDNISHDWIINNVPVEKKILNQWLKCGYVEANKLYSNAAGTPQGGIISPTIANMVLDGMEDMLDRRYKIPRIYDGKKTWSSRTHGYNPQIHLIRYADDFIVTCNSEKVLEEEVKPMLVEFLRLRGLELSVEKTLITRMDSGFDFLGFNIRSYKGKLIIKPSQGRIKRLKEKVSEVFDRCSGTNAEILITKLNPILRGWANYYSHVAAAKTFSAISHWLWEKTWRWARKQHPMKNKQWIKDKYYAKIGKRDWIFHARDDKGEMVRIFDIKKVKITHHPKVKKLSNPFAREDADYFRKRKERNRRSNLQPSAESGC